LVGLTQGEVGEFAFEQVDLLEVVVADDALGVVSRPASQRASRVRITSLDRLSTRSDTPGLLSTGCHGMAVVSKNSFLARRRRKSEATRPSRGAGDEIEHAWPAWKVATAVLTGGHRVVWVRFQLTLDDCDSPCVMAQDWLSSCLN